jgi:hypothetical protein
MNMRQRWTVGATTLALLAAGCGRDQPRPTSAPVPRLTGLTLRQAEQRLEGAKLPWVLSGDGEIFRSAGRSSGGANRGEASARVVGQEPRAGARLVPEDAVLLRLAS